MGAFRVGRSAQFVAGSHAAESTTEVVVRTHTAPVGMFAEASLAAPLPSGSTRSQPRPIRAHVSGHRVIRHVRAIRTMTTTHGEQWTTLLPEGIRRRHDIDFASAGLCQADFGSKVQGTFAPY